MIEAQGVMQHLLARFLDENELLQSDSGQLTDALARVGAAREEYERQTANAESTRILIISEAIADGVKKIRQAEAEGLLALGNALAKLDDPQSVLKLMEMASAQAVAKALAEGEATTVFGSSGLIDVMHWISTSSAITKA